ncbi:type VI secretion system-associated FHA domain protein TagH [Beijerinckia mobilis]|uniref:type VI secretion system-associated FHA domain protein TagH n=1 Tax=Beijerinckia mobilis TaxID=231434 RepID=UPI0009FE68AF|nr:type VI secretion system-associated FHA domain protein TagH [Beijerinckia mobilis]
MRLTLTIDNLGRRPDGGPLSYVVEGQRRIDIGRDRHLDWCLPDDKGEISRRHCEITPRDGAYFLVDVSTNGTYVNSAEKRVQSPYRLRDGDRLFIGDYIVAVAIEGDQPVPDQEGSVGRRAPANPDIWASSGPVAPPIDPKLLRSRQVETAPHVDWINRVADQPTPIAPPLHALAVPARDAASIWGRPLGLSGGPLAELPSGTPQARPPQPGPQPLGNQDEAVAVWGTAPGRVSAVPSRDHEAPSPPEPPRPAQDAAPAEARDDDAFLAAFSRALDIPQDTFAAMATGELGALIGALIRLVVDEMRQLLRARAEAKRLTRSASHTIIEAQGNNPLKFAPTTEEALRLLLGAPRPGYLDLQTAVSEAFTDVKTHEIRTYAAMQEAVRMLAKRLDPSAIDGELSRDSHIVALFNSRKGRLWDAYVARWDGMSPRDGDKLTGAFMNYFAEYYDRTDNRK